METWFLEAAQQLFFLISNGFRTNKMRSLYTCIPSTCMLYLKVNIGVHVKDFINHIVNDESTPSP